MTEMTLSPLPYCPEYPLDELQKHALFTERVFPEWLVASALLGTKTSHLTQSNGLQLSTESRGQENV